MSLRFTFLIPTCVLAKSTQPFAGPTCTWDQEAKGLADTCDLVLCQVDASTYIDIIDSFLGFRFGKDYGPRRCHLFRMFIFLDSRD